MKTLGWRLWYDANDGVKVYNSNDHNIAILPRDGCLGCVVYYSKRVTPKGPHYRDIVSGRDWYYIHEDKHIEAFGNKQGGIWDDPPDIESRDRLIRSAPTYPDSKWEEIRKEMMGATEWP